MFSLLQKLCIHKLFISHMFNKCLLNSHYWPGIVLDAQVSKATLPVLPLYRGC